MAILKLFPLFLLLTLTSCIQEKTAATNCIQTKASIDMGSGTTKLLIAKINSCQKRIIERIEQKNCPIPFKDNLIQNNNFIPVSLFKKTKRCYQEIRKLLDQNAVKNVSVVATEAFRNANNSRELFDLIQNTVNLSPKLISQEEEKELGRHSASLVSKISDKDLAVWDIGGGSAQISTNKKSALSKIAAVTYADWVMKLLGHKNTPNPIQKGDVQKILEKSKELFQNEFSNAFSEELSSYQLVGIGGVHAESLLSRLPPKEGTQTICQMDLNRLVQRELGKSDKDFNSPYAKTEMTNILLVLSTLGRFNKDCYKIVKASLLEGLLFQ